MMTNYEMVKEFHEKFGMQIGEKFNLDDVILRFRLIDEELEELEIAIEEQDGVPEYVAKELTDLLYVVYGAGITWGIDMDKAFKLVHESNMSKLDENGKPVYREDGKVLKGPNFKPADMTPSILK